MEKASSMEWSADCGGRVGFCPGTPLKWGPTPLFLVITTALDTSVRGSRASLEKELNGAGGQHQAPGDAQRPKKTQTPSSLNEACRNRSEAEQKRPKGKPKKNACWGCHPFRPAGIRFTRSVLATYQIGTPWPAHLLARGGLRLVTQKAFLRLGSL